MLQGKVDDERSNDDEKQGLVRENQVDYVTYHKLVIRTRLD